MTRTDANTAHSTTLDWAQNLADEANEAEDYWEVLAPHVERVIEDGWLFYVGDHVFIGLNSDELEAWVGDPADYPER